MHKIKKFSLLSLIALAGLLALPFSPPARAAIPATGLQFPYYVYSQTLQVTNVGTTETNLFQVSLPQQQLGNNGFLRFRLFVSSPDGTANATHTFKVYLGGTGGTGTTFAGGTAISTNTMTGGGSATLEHCLFNQNALNANSIDGVSTTNSFAAVATQMVPVNFNTGTNFNFTVTGAGQFSTNVFRLDGIIVEAVTMP